jgi:uncharacterized membrane protein YhaH (DUF805 family)
VGIWDLIRAGRMSRLQYWACTAAFLALLMMGPKLLPTTMVALVMIPLWMLMVGAPRLREIGWSPWWALALMAPTLLVSVVADFASLPPDSQPRAALTRLSGFAVLGFLVLLGAMPSKRAKGAPAPAED